MLRTHALHCRRDVNVLNCKKKTQKINYQLPQCADRKIAFTDTKNLFPRTEESSSSSHDAGVQKKPWPLETEKIKEMPPKKQVLQTSKNISHEKENVIPGI